MDFTPGDAYSYPCFFKVVGDRMYFAANGYLWHTDGTVEGTKKIEKVPVTAGTGTMNGMLYSVGSTGSDNLPTRNLLHCTPQLLPDHQSLIQ